jgi:hypothetical protein
VRALVVFHGAGPGAAWWARGCLDGFKHCFIALDDGRYWVVFDGTIGALRLDVTAAADFDLAAHYRSHGLKVVETETRAEPPFWPLILATCVGAIKRILVIRAPWVLTPLQLYRYLKRREEK